MKSFATSPHTADVRLAVKADSLKELIEVALEGMNKIIFKGSESDLEEIKMEKDIIVRAADMTSLLVDFLSEVLSFTHEEKSIFYKIEFNELSDKFLDAKIYGRKAPFFSEDVKAVTYHEAEVKFNKKGELETVLIFDI